MHKVNKQNFFNMILNPMKLYTVQECYTTVMFKFEEQQVQLKKYYWELNLF